MQAAEGLPQLVGMARFDVDGSFSAMTGEAQGLMPGQYKIAIQCWQQCARPRDKGFGKPQEDGLRQNVRQWNREKA